MDSLKVSFLKCTSTTASETLVMHRTTFLCLSLVLVPSTVLSPLVTGRFWGVKGGSPNQRPWSLSHDGLMSLGFGPWLPISIDESLVGYHVITRATGAGGLALWRTYAARFSLFPVNLRSCWTSSLGSRGASGGGGF